MWDPGNFKNLKIDSTRKSEDQNTLKAAKDLFDVDEAKGPYDVRASSRI